MLSGYNPRMHEVPWNKHGGSNRNFDKNVVKTRNSFAPFLSDVLQGNKETRYKHEKTRNPTKSMHANEATKLLKMRGNVGAQEYEFILGAMCKGNPFNSSLKRNKKCNKMIWVKKDKLKEK